MSEKVASKIRLPQETRLAVRQLAISQQKLKYLYEVIDSAIIWSSLRTSELQPLLPPRSTRDFVTLYYTQVDTLTKLADCWDCNVTEALYTAVQSYTNAHAGNL